MSRHPSQYLEHSKCSTEILISTAFAYIVLCTTQLFIIVSILPWSNSSPSSKTPKSELPLWLEQEAWHSSSVCDGTVIFIGLQMIFIIIDTGNRNTIQKTYQVLQVGFHFTIGSHHRPDNMSAITHFHIQSLQPPLLHPNKGRGEEKKKKIKPATKIIFL